jgi:hypothetical protein
MTQTTTLPIIQKLSSKVTLANRNAELEARVAELRAANSLAKAFIESIDAHKHEDGFEVWSALVATHTKASPLYEAAPVLLQQVMLLADHLESGTSTPAMRALRVSEARAVIAKAKKGD